MFSQIIEKNSDGSLKYGIEAFAVITTINDKKDLGSNQTLIEIKDATDNDFKTTTHGVSIVAKAKNGKEISINESFANDMISNKNTKTMPHEAGHTAGLRHPYHDFNSYLLGLFTTHGETANSLASNFMRQGAINSPTGPTKAQMERMYRIYKSGGLNKRTGTHPVDQK